jgi:hypothetical protein
VPLQVHTPVCRRCVWLYCEVVGNRRKTDDDVENFQGMPWGEFLEILDARAAKKFPPKNARRFRAIPIPSEEQSAGE